MICRMMCMKITINVDLRFKTELDLQLQICIYAYECLVKLFYRKSYKFEKQKNNIKTVKISFMIFSQIAANAYLLIRVSSERVVRILTLVRESATYLSFLLLLQNVIALPESDCRDCFGW